ncbi:11439_t:CDS:2, partial [Paraglomus brasilianum]
MTIFKTADVSIRERLVLFPKRQLLNTTIQFSKGTVQKDSGNAAQTIAKRCPNYYVHVEDENNWTILTDEDVIELVNREEISSESEAETVEKLETISNRTASTSIDTVLKFLYQKDQNLARLSK